MDNNVLNPNNDVGTVEVPNIDTGGYMDKLQDVAQYNNAFEMAEAAKQRDWTEKQNQIAMDYNSAEAQKNRDWQTKMSNTQIQRRVEDAVRAGINPIYAIMGGSGATVGNGSSASFSSNGTGSKANADTSLVSGIASLLNTVIGATVNSAVATAANKTSMWNSTQSALASRYAADQGLKGSYAIAGATMYSANVQKEINEKNLNQQKNITAMNNITSVINQIQEYSGTKLSIGADGKLTAAGGSLSLGANYGIQEYLRTNPYLISYLQAYTGSGYAVETQRLAESLLSTLRNTISPSHSNGKF